jgi:hypothetical protein
MVLMNLISIFWCDRITNSTIVEWGYNSKDESNNDIDLKKR